jgi:hypothetical protein
MLGLAVVACGGSDPATNSGPWDVTVAYAVLSPGVQASACLADQCTPTRTADASGRVTWDTVVRFDRSQLEGGLSFVVTDSSARTSCAGRTFRPTAEDFSRGRAVVVCDGPVVQFYLRPG